jgi:hypothetical protein
MNVSRVKDLLSRNRIRCDECGRDEDEGFHAFLVDAAKEITLCVSCAEDLRVHLGARVAIIEPSSGSPK